jgi:hypothetical protein
MLTLCQNSEHCALFLITDYRLQRGAFEMYFFESADFQMSLSDIEIELNP